MPVAPPAAAHNASEGNIKDTIESILVAFILAFIFRAFVVEAFVIPTGSMAPTLMGAHMRFRCEDCGYAWTVNFSSPGDGDDMFIPRRANDFLRDRDKVFALRCPNCGHRVPRQDPVDPDNSATNPPVCYGDRILVLKYLYLFEEPKRWDVVVFKAPAEPQRWDYSQNYIKRLVGRPGETIMILDGDIYAAQNPSQKLDSLKPADFQIQTKPHSAQEALWRIVYDNDYYPQGVRRVRTDPAGRETGVDSDWQQPWTVEAGSGWDLGTGPVNGRKFHFKNPSGSSTLAFDADANPDKQALTDWLAYDVTVNQGPNQIDTYDRSLYHADNYVSDLKLSFFYQRTDGQGALRAELTKLDKTFVAEILPTKVSLYERAGNGPEKLLQSADMELGSRPARIDFMNVDYQVSLSVNGQQVLKTSADQYHPDVQALLDAFRAGTKLARPTIRVLAANQSCEISHLSLWRDVYYMNRQPSFQGGGRLRWGSPDNFPSGVWERGSDGREHCVCSLIPLGPQEYFVCGDNSPISGDARYWDDPINLSNESLNVESGRVPGRFLLGKAFFVYWPAGFRPLDSAPALVPNFGQMRFIH